MGAPFDLLEINKRPLEQEATEIFLLLSPLALRPPVQKSALALRACPLSPPPAVPLVSRHTVTTLTINNLQDVNPSYMTAQTVTMPSQFLHS